MKARRGGILIETALVLQTLFWIVHHHSLLIHEELERLEMLQKMRVPLDGELVWMPEP